MDDSLTRQQLRQLQTVLATADHPIYVGVSVDQLFVDVERPIPPDELLTVRRRYRLLLIDDVLPALTEVCLLTYDRRDDTVTVTPVGKRSMASQRRQADGSEKP